MSKYNSKKAECDGITFDSKDEMKYYEALKIRKAKVLRMGASIRDGKVL